MKTLASNLTKLSRQYGISLKTFKKMLLEHPEIQLSKSRRTLSPKEVELIYVCLGKPPEFQKA